MKTASYQKQLYRNPSAAAAAGVCAGIADYLGTDRTLVRIAAVVAGVLLTKITLIAYAAAWILVDER